jgi:hypothetical protein
MRQVLKPCLEQYREKEGRKGRREEGKEGGLGHHTRIDIS